MTVQNKTTSVGATTVLDRPAVGSVYASLFEKINLSPVVAGFPDAESEIVRWRK